MFPVPSDGRSRLDRPDRLDRAVDMERAAAILVAAQTAGAVLCMEGNKLKVRNSVRLPAAVRADLNAHWRAVAALFSGDHCRCCGGLIDWRRDGVAFADGTAAHVLCEDRWHAELARRQAARALTPEALADPAELMIRGELLP
jgi:hypothetical protein